MVKFPKIESKKGKLLPDLPVSQGLIQYKGWAKLKGAKFHFLLVATVNASIKFNDFGTYKLHKATSGTMPILS